MSQLTYNPRIVIDGLENVHLISATYSSKNNNTISSLNAVIDSSDFKESKLFGSKVEFFLNCGSEDGNPIFVGFVKQADSTEEKINIKAVDVRGFLAQSDINLTDENNYDGYSLGSFLKEYIDKHINNEYVTYINTNNINDTKPKVLLTGKRGNFNVMSLVNSMLKDSKDDSDVSRMLDYTIDVIGNSIFFKKKKRLDDYVSLSLSLHNGIQSFTYKERPVIFQAVYDDKKFVYGSNPSGPFTKKISTEKEWPAEKAEEVYKDIINKLDNNKEITVNSSVGHYVGLDSIIYLNVDDSNISGTHRVVSKTITFGKGAMSLSLGLNNTPAKISEYLN